MRTSSLAVLIEGIAVQYSTVVYITVVFLLFSFHLSYILFGDIPVYYSMGPRRDRTLNVDYVIVAK